MVAASFILYLIWKRNMYFLEQAQLKPFLMALLANKNTNFFLDIIFKWLSARLIKAQEM